MRLFLAILGYGYRYETESTVPAVETSKQLASRAMTDLLAREAFHNAPTNQRLKISEADVILRISIVGHGSVQSYKSVTSSAHTLSNQDSLHSLQPM